MRFLDNFLSALEAHIATPYIREQHFALVRQLEFDAIDRWKRYAETQRRMREAHEAGRRQQDYRRYAETEETVQVVSQWVTSTMGLCGILQVLPASNTFTDCPSSKRFLLWLHGQRKLIDFAEEKHMLPRTSIEMCHDEHCEGCSNKTGRFSIVQEIKGVKEKRFNQAVQLW